jgi:hypothetical protein
LDPASIIVDGISKLEDYIKYKEDSEKAIVAAFVPGIPLTFLKL